MTATAKIVFMPSGHRGTFAVGTPVLEAARSLGVDVDSVCGGRGLCGRCQVHCVEGSFAKHEIHSAAHNLSAATEAEQHYQRRRGPLAAGRRLGCQAMLLADVVVDVPPESQVHRQVVRKQAEQRDIVLDTSTRLHYVEVAEADMHNPSGDLTRLKDALTREWQLDIVDCDISVYPVLQPALREGNWKVTVAVRNGSRIAAVWPGYRDTIYGVAVDVGSTTIAAHMVDLVTGNVVACGGIMNPQIRFGEDLMSRVSYVMMHAEGAAQLTGAVREGIARLIGQVATDAGASADDVIELTVVGNPIMHHLLLGISPVELGGAPFALCIDSSVSVRAADLDLDVHPGAWLYVLPCIAGHVGADTAAMVLSEEPQRRDEISLLIDVGTNAEIVLGNRDRLLACSSPTGPAFEGAQISCGQRAAPGAIERVRIDAQTLEPRIRIIGCELWSDEPGFAEAASRLGVTGICGSGIIEAVAQMYLAGIVSADGVIHGALRSRTPRVIADGRTWSFVLYDGDKTICVSQTDIRQIQLAKAALYAGVKLLMDKLGIQSVQRIRLAGAFGNHIDVKHAMVLGMIPDCPLDEVTSAGNAAGTGARIALLNQAARREIEVLVRHIEKIETAIEPRFQEYFVDAMAIPHKVDAFAHLFATVSRPMPLTTSGANDESRRRRRQKRN